MSAGRPKVPPMHGEQLERFRALCADEPEPVYGCAVCGKARRPERSRLYAGEAANLDPFCSSECARAWHGTPLPITTTGPRR